MAWYPTPRRPQRREATASKPWCSRCHPDTINQPQWNYCQGCYDADKIWMHRRNCLKDYVTNHGPPSFHPRRHTTITRDDAIKELGQLQSIADPSSYIAERISTLKKHDVNNPTVQIRDELQAELDTLTNMQDPSLLGPFVAKQIEERTKYLREELKPSAGPQPPPKPPSPAQLSDLQTQITKQKRAISTTEKSLEHHNKRVAQLRDDQEAQEEKLESLNKQMITLSAALYRDVTGDGTVPGTPSSFAVAFRSEIADIRSLLDFIDEQNETIPTERIGGAARRLQRSISVTTGPPLGFDPDIDLDPAFRSELEAIDEIKDIPGIYDKICDLQSSFRKSASKKDRHEPYTGSQPPPRSDELS